MSGVRASGLASLAVIAATAFVLSSCASSTGPSGVVSPVPTVSGASGGATATKTGAPSAAPSAAPAFPPTVSTSSGRAAATPSQSAGSDPQNPVDPRKPTSRPTGSSH